MKTTLARLENGVGVIGIDRLGFEIKTPAPASVKTPPRAARDTNSRQPIQPVSERFPALEKQEVEFSITAPEAEGIYLAGCFNGWRPDITPLKKTSAGKWLVRLKLRSGQYEYRFVVDGRWIEDPGALQHVANSYGGFNSILTVPLAVETSIL